MSLVFGLLVNNGIEAAASGQQEGWWPWLLSRSAVGPLPVQPKGIAGQSFEVNDDAFDTEGSWVRFGDVPEIFNPEQYKKTMRNFIQKKYPEMQNCPSRDEGDVVQRVSPVRRVGRSVSPLAQVNSSVAVGLPQGQRLVSSLRTPAAVAQRSQLRFIDVPVLQQNSATEWPVEQESKVDERMSGLLWKNVRNEDGTNCAYHALKNILIALHQRSEDVEKYLSLDPLFDVLRRWVPVIYDGRLRLVKKELGIPDNQKASDRLLLSKRSSLTQGWLRSYVNSNDGHIKTEFLEVPELQRLVDGLPMDLQNNIVVLDDQKARILQGSPQEVAEAVMLMGFEDQATADALQATETRLQAFKKSLDGTLAVAWTECGFDHWVAYVIQKKAGQILQIQYMNSIADKKPKMSQYLFDLLGIKQ